VVICLERGADLHMAQLNLFHSDNNKEQPVDRLTCDEELRDVTRSDGFHQVVTRSVVAAAPHGSVLHAEALRDDDAGSSRGRSLQLPGEADGRGALCAGGQRADHDAGETGSRRNGVHAGRHSG